MGNGANGQSCLTEREFDIGAAPACLQVFSPVHRGGGGPGGTGWPPNFYRT